MTSEIAKRKRFLFVDDDVALLALLRELFGEMSKGGWEIFTAANHAQALAELQRHRMDVVVLDISLPVMDGIQFLLLLRRSHPDQQVVMLTGNATEANRKTCLDHGAALFLQKPTAQGDYATIFSALDMLAGAKPNEGFRGIMKRVGLHEVLQFECLGRRSSILEIFTVKVRGRIYILDGTIVHAECGTLQGEVALYSILALRGGEFNLLAFTEPARRTIEGSWEMLLMEAARLSDEAAQPGAAEAPKPAPAEPAIASAPPVAPPSTQSPPPVAKPEPPAPPPAPSAARIVEVLLCSGAGEVLYDWQCTSILQRLGLMQEIEQHALNLSSLASVGRFERLEIVTAGERAVCQIHPQRRLLVRSALGKPETP